MCEIFIKYYVNQSSKSVLILLLIFIVVIPLKTSCTLVDHRPQLLDSYYRDPRVPIPPIRDPRYYGGCVWVSNRTCPDTDVKFYLYTPDNPNDRQYIRIEDTWEKSNLSESNFNPFIPIKIIIHGYNSDMFLNPLIQIKDEYLKKGDYNLFYVDWSVLAKGPCYIWAVNNLKHVGECVAQLVERIADIGIIDVHMIGFSLGAQLTNFVARKLNDFRLKRITGLDPAMPLFISAGPENKLDPSDAEFVDVIHTNALVQGKIERCGHVDFYMNGGIMQPGCFQMAENPFACSHHRAPDYYKESINSLKGFWGWGCSSYISYMLGFCPPTNYLVLAGDEARPDTYHGMYLIKTSDHFPFALGKWTDLSQPSLHKSPFDRRDPFMEIIDDYGKVDGDFNHQTSVRSINQRHDLNFVQSLVSQLKNVGEPSRSKPNNTVTLNEAVKRNRFRQQFVDSWKKGYNRTFYASSTYHPRKEGSSTTMTTLKPVSENNLPENVNFSEIFAN